MRRTEINMQTAKLQQKVETSNMNTRTDVKGLEQYSRNYFKGKRKKMY